MTHNLERDIHILRYFSSFISVSNGKVINVTEPSLAFCPLASHLYKDFKKNESPDKEKIKLIIKSAIESKIRDYGFFTAKRKLLQCDTSIPYGASEMLMFALKKKAIDAAVIVCDGAGTIITDNGEIAQGVGARMNSLLLTSPIKETMTQLKKLDCQVVFDNAMIDQVKGVEKAINSGYKKIAVTLSGHDSERLKEIRSLESSGDAAVTILSVCTTGITGVKIDEIRRYADIVWSCASWDIRHKIGEVALLQISKQIPVFVLAQKGIDFIASYAEDNAILHGLSKQKQYLISNESGGQKVKLGAYNCFLREESLPVLSERSFATVSS
jgi:putative methanogenesis marker protein 8